MSLSLKRDSRRPVNSSKRKRMRAIIDIGSPLFYFSGVIFLLFLQPTVAAGGEILIPPVSQRIAIGSEKAMFYCQTRGSDARWLVGEDYYDPENGTENGIKFIEHITYHEYDSTGNVFDIRMWIPSQSVWNMTQIICVSSIDQETHSDPAELIIMGGPAAPEPSLRMISSSRLVLEWNRSFTWEGHPIEHYVLKSNNSLYYTPKLKIENATMARGNVQIERREGIEECEVIEFSVIANNGLADSEAGSVTGGFPIALDMSNVMIMKTLTFNDDLTPIISLEIQLPRVCSFQDIQYNITLTRMDIESDVLLYTSQRLEYRESHTVTEIFNDNLINGATYRATAIFWTFAEDDDSVSAPMEVSTTIYAAIDAATDAATETPFTPTLDGPFTPTLDGPFTQTLDGATRSIPLTKEYIIIIGAGGGGVILVLLVLIIIALVVCTNARKRSRFYSSRSDIQNRPLPMITNPIYEGSPVYETVGHQLNSLERPRTPTTPTSISPLLIESPYTVTTVDPSYTQSVQPFPTENENYTVMISPLRNKVPARQVSNLDQDVRYVPEPGSAIITRSDW